MEISSYSEDVFENIFTLTFPLGFSDLPTALRNKNSQHRKWWTDPFVSSSLPKKWGWFINDRFFFKIIGKFIQVTICIVILKTLFSLECPMILILTMTYLTQKLIFVPRHLLDRIWWTDPFVVSSSLYKWRAIHKIVCKGYRL